MFTTVFDEPAARSPSLMVSPGLSGTAEADGAAEPEAAADGAADATATDGAAEPDAPGDAEAPPAIIVVQSPGTRLAGIGSVTPAATTPIVTAVWLLPRSVRIAPPVMLLPFAGWNCRIAWFRPDGLGEPAGADTGALTGAELAAGVPVAPATPPLDVLLPHAAIVRIAVATRPADANRRFRDMVLSSSFLGKARFSRANATSGVPGQRRGVTDARRILAPRWA